MSKRLQISAAVFLFLVGVGAALGVYFRTVEKESVPVVKETKTVLLKKGGRTVTVDLLAYPVTSGSVAYQGPVLEEGEENFKEPHTYTGVTIKALLDAVGGIQEGDRVAVIATDGWTKELPYAVIAGETECGSVILALLRDGASVEEWRDAPELVFLPEDERFTNDDMLAAFGEELSHYYDGRPSTTGLLVKNVAYLVVNYDGGALPAADGD